MSASATEIAVFTVGVAMLATALILIPGILIAWVLARRRFIGKAFVETIVSLPLVTPPVATGLILLWAFGARGPFGRALHAVGVDVVFTWKAVVIAMAVMGLPLLVRAARAGFEQVNERYEQMAATLGAGPARVFLTISLPLAARSVLAGAVLAFSRALGEFGATIMVAGSIPGRTLTLPVAIYSYAETGRDRDVVALVLISVAIAFAAVALSNRLLQARAV
jgi:molybdate transport system permease protein